MDPALEAGFPVCAGKPVFFRGDAGKAKRPGRALPQSSSPNHPRSAGPAGVKQSFQKINSSRQRSGAGAGAVPGAPAPLRALGGRCSAQSGARGSAGALPRGAGHDFPLPARPAIAGDRGYFPPRLRRVGKFRDDNIFAVFRKSPHDGAIIPQSYLSRAPACRAARRIQHLTTARSNRLAGGTGGKISPREI